MPDRLHWVCLYPYSVCFGGLFKICSAYSLVGVGDAIYAGCFDSPAGKWGHLQSCDLFIFHLEKRLVIFDRSSFYH